MVTHDLKGTGSVGGRMLKNNSKSFWRSRQGPLERWVIHADESRCSVCVPAVGVKGSYVEVLREMWYERGAT